MLSRATETRLGHALTQLRGALRRDPPGRLRSVDASEQAGPDVRRQLLDGDATFLRGPGQTLRAARLTITVTSGRESGTSADEQ